MNEAARILAVRDRVLGNLPKVELVGNALAVARHAVHPTVGADTTGHPAARDCAAALSGIKGAR